MIYFTSDLHIGHNKSFIYKDRGFNNIEEHDQYIIDTWKSKINPSDEIYILGDISWLSGWDTNNILESLPGKKYLILGNHDYPNDISQYKHNFQWIRNYYELKYNKRTFVLFHYPIESWNKQRHGSIHLFGHVHLQEHREVVNKENRIHIGFDIYKDFINIEEILNNINNKK